MVRKIVFDKIIPPKSALAFSVKKGQFLRIIDLEGKQVGDLILFNEHDYTEKLSTGYTLGNIRIAEPRRHWVWLGCRGVTTGHQLISTIRNPMMTITADTPVPGGVHDLLMRMCSSWNYEQSGAGSRDGCLELLTKALEPYGIARGNIPDAFNAFMNVYYDARNGMFFIDEPISRPGDYIEFRTEMDCLAALSACPDDVNSLCNGTPPHPAKPLQVQISEMT